MQTFNRKGDHHKAVWIMEKSSLIKNRNYAKDSVMLPVDHKLLLVFYQ